jgi:hypothetical protein
MRAFLSLLRQNNDKADTENSRYHNASPATGKN